MVTMFRPGKSKSISDLRRRKSTSSFTRKQDRVDPEAARQQAHAAATYAFNRARERSSTEFTGRRGIPDLYSAATQQSHRRISLPEDLAAPDQQAIRRQQSVRFVGQRTAQRHQSTDPKASQDAVSTKASSGTLRPRALTNNTCVPADCRPPSRSSSIGKASLRNGKAADFATAVAAYDEYYTKEDDIASAPSSYRHVRRVKSVLNEPRSRTSGVFFHDGTPDSKTSGSLPKPRYLRVRAPKSMSFLRGVRDHTRPDSYQEPDVGVQGARDKFLYELEQQRLRAQPSFIFRSHARREEKPFRKSVRSASANYYGSPIALPNQPALLSKNTSFRHKARKVSQTIRNKLKSLFNRTETEETIVPDQQVEARFSHENQLSPQATHVDLSGVSDTTRLDDATFSHVASRVPSLHSVPSYQQLRSRAGSVRSLRSDVSSKSRVTSWTSTREDTANSRFTAADREKERQRLSVIQENGTHASTRSISRPSVRNLSSPYPTFHYPQDSVTRATMGPAPTPLTQPPVDSAKVYSALMKRFDENSPKVKLAHRTGSVESLNAPYRVPPRKSSLVSLRGASAESLGLPSRVPPRKSSINSLRIKHEENTPTTIRRVPAEDLSIVMTKEQEDLLLGRAQGLSRSNSDDVFSSQSLDRLPLTGLKNGCAKSYGDPQANPEAEFIGTPYSQIDIETQRDDFEYLKHEASDQDHAAPFKSRHKPRGLSERGSGFFGSTPYTVSRTTSPYRRAMAEHEYDPAVLTGETPVRRNQSKETGVIHSSESSDTLDIASPLHGLAYSESIYSRTTSGRTPAASESTLALTVPKEQDLPLTITRPSAYSESGSGGAVILEHATYKPKQRTRPPSISAGSIEWKSWMSAQVSALEWLGQSHSKAIERVSADYTTPWTTGKQAGGHVREDAQIDGDDVEIKPSRAKGQLQPIGLVLQALDRDNSIKSDIALKAAVNEQSNLGHTAGEPGVDSPTRIPVPPPLPPPIPQRSPLRPIQSRGSMQSVRSAGQKTEDSPVSAIKLVENSPCMVLQKKSSGSIHSVDTPTSKLVRKVDRRSGYTTSSSGNATFGAAERQFCSTKSRTSHSTSETRLWTAGSRMIHSSKGDENYVPANNATNDEYGAAGAGLMGPQVQMVDAQIMGSKKMVDIFLSSRRKRMAESEETNAFI